LKEWIKLLSNTLLTNTDSDSKKDGKKLKSVMITDDEWDLLVDLTEVLSIFADVTTELGGSNYVTSSLRVRMLIEIIKTLTTRSSDQQTYIDEQDDAFDDGSNEEENQDDDINKPVITFGLLDAVKSNLYMNMKKYYPTLVTAEVLIPSILDPRFKSLDFVSSEQKIMTEQHLHQLFKQEKEKQNKASNTPNTSETPDVSNNSRSRKRKTLMERLAKDSVAAAPDNEVSEYLQMHEIPIKSDPLIWWNEKKDKFPILSNLAQKYLAVSATSTASERLFSDAGNLLTNKRTCMKPKLFKKIMFLKRNASML
jgi:hypothetical protein